MSNFKMEKTRETGQKGINIDQLINFIFQKSTGINNQIKYLQLHRR